MARLVVRLSVASLRAYWRPRALRTREGVARSFGPVFIVLIFVLLPAGAVFLYDMETHPLTANAAQSVDWLCLRRILTAADFLSNTGRPPLACAQKLQSS